MWGGWAGISYDGTSFVPCKLKICVLVSFPNPCLLWHSFLWLRAENQNSHFSFNFGREQRACCRWRLRGLRRPSGPSPVPPGLATLRRPGSPMFQGFGQFSGGNLKTPEHKVAGLKASYQRHVNHRKGEGSPWRGSRRAPGGAAHARQNSLRLQSSSKRWGEGLPGVVLGPHTLEKEVQPKQAWAGIYGVELEV